MSRRGKKQRRDERSASLTTKSEYEEDKKDPMVMGDITVNDWMMRRCMELEATVKSLQREIRVLKSIDWKTKCQMRIDYDWDGEEVNLSDKVWALTPLQFFPFTVNI